ncbi:MAG TPA: S8 family serine peptidase [Herpetosiphonaceae bacterium]
MRSPRYLLVTVALLTSALFTTAIGQASPAQQAPDAAIRLKAATFRPARGEAPAIPPGLARAGYAEGERGYYIVQFGAPVEQAWKDQVSAAGGELLDYIPDFAFKVRMNPAQARRVEQLGSVAWVGVFQPAYKLSPDLKRNSPNLYAVRVERGADAGLAAAAIARTNAQVLGRQGNYLLVGADSAQLDALAQVVDVAWVENFLLPEKHNQYGAGAIMGSNTANALGYDGSTQTVAVADTGIGGGTAATAHPDIPSARVTAVYNWPGTTDSCFQTIVDDGAQDVDSGHGTHVAGSVLSDGDASGNNKGTAPAAKLVFQATENWVRTSSLCKNFYGYLDDYYLTGLPLDLRQLFQQAYSAGARIHANSWGSAAAGDYTANSANADDFIWNNRDMTITFSAGNEGIDANANGVIDNDSTGSPATAKNVITIGASENDRQGHFECDTSLTYTSRDTTYQSGQTCASMGGQNLLGTYGQRWGADYPANPIASDLSGGNQEQMAAFSSRGPTDDGRIKPDVVAPGTWILSSYSGKFQEGYGTATNPQNGAFQSDGWGMPASSQYKYFGGTSMSNPLAAGGAAVVRDYYQKAHSVNASSALTKATLINSAVDLQDENNDGANDNDFPIPNVHEGWGRINLVKATSGSLQFVDRTTGLSTNATATYQANVSTAGPLKLSLVWSDYASTETATKNLVNDLDVTLTSPTGTVYRGNVFSGGWSTTGGTADRTNNVENIYVQSAATGTWTITVSAFNVPNGPQPFALVVDGGALTVPPPPPAMHIGDLDGTKAMVGNRWQATVTATVHNDTHGAVAGATVTGTWSGGSTGTGTCTTNSAGQCSGLSATMQTNKASTTFTVTNVSQSSYTYQSSSNHDPESDSNGTAITVTKP